MPEKKTLIILPGWGGSHETWQGFIDLAKEHYKAVCIDLPCFGGVPCPPTAWGIEEYSEFVRSKLSNVKGQMSKVILLGHSFGGQVATYLAAKHPELVEKLILSGAAVIRPNRPLRRLFFGAVAKTGKLLFRLPFVENYRLWAEKVLYRTADSPDYAKTSGLQREIFKKIIRQDLQALLPAIAMPTLIVWGGLDQYMPLSHGKKIAASLPKATLAVIPRATHGLHRHNTEDFFRILHNFISARA